MSKKRKHGQDGNSKTKGGKGGGPASKRHRKGGAPPPAPKKPQASQQAAQPPRRTPPPFQKSSTVLLVGEGDFSFALSLRRALGVRNVIATCHDSEADLHKKYPQAKENIAAFLAPPEARKAEYVEGEEVVEDDDEDDETPAAANAEVNYQVHYSIDATALLKRRMFSKSSRRYDFIVFMFPHVGGATKDQDRQVRYNQQLLAGFFKHARPLLKPVTGSVAVTLFEGLPYELWNIRGLAKEAGLATRVSFVFESEMYPGYAHVRTLGNIEGGGAWKGEDRAARMFLFGVAGEGSLINRKRKAKASDDDDED
ncbi:hypothetical protein BZA05DRAFT_334757 [Tricharina praecox]|uniref:uncharacterized protein n=1 Tax=Tricharina praecox TaxID=43433 RepID=UPI002220BC3B|nr:uncharacterized protein BZA05DRAFT_334757 [Tricharina praecox]KAI5854843.1 hypothetical protein BZA05DRAFT_334757 [Tricharina praecox]